MLEPWTRGRKWAEGPGVVLAAQSLLKADAPLSLKAEAPMSVKMEAQMWLKSKTQVLLWTTGKTRMDWPWTPGVSKTPA